MFPVAKTVVKKAFKWEKWGKVNLHVNLCVHEINSNYSK